MEQRKVQWHPAFCSAMRLELRDNREELKFYNEYNLNSKPLEIDLLVIVMRREAVIRNVIGKFFRKHNIMEYKSEDDELNVDTYYKGQGYCCLYKAMAETAGGISEEEITLTLVRKRKPRKLMRYFEEKGHYLTNPAPGIYYVNKGGIFPTQIVVTGELEEREHVWLSSLRRGLKEEGAQQLIFSITKLKERNEREAGQSVLQAALRANPEVFGEVKEEHGMVCEALKELMAPEMEEERKRLVKEAEQEREKLVREAEEGRKKLKQEFRQEQKNREEQMKQRMQQQMQKQMQQMKQSAIQSARTAFAAGLDFDLVTKLLPSLTEAELRKIKEEV